MKDKINVIATAANQRKKPTKRVAFDRLITLIENGDENRRGDVLADLYAFFMPPVPKTPKTAFDWVASAAAGKNDVRACLRMIRADGNRLYATNGHILFIDNSDKRDAGYYDTAGNPVDDSATYPDIDRVIPQGEGIEINPSEILAGECVSTGTAYGDAIRIGKIHVNRQYLCSALVFMECREAPVTMFARGPSDAIRFDCGELTAVIMPVRV